MRRGVAGVAAGLLLASVALRTAEAQSESSFAEFSWGLGAGLCTLVYTPVKVAYAATALPLGALVWLWSVGDTDVAGRVIRQATGGDYVVTPSHLKRERTLVFLARDPQDDDPSAESRTDDDE